METVRANARYTRAASAVAELLSKLRLDSVFVGGVAASAWLGTDLAGGSIDVLVLLRDEQKNQVAMMASNRGFRVDREELEATFELDLVPLHFIDPEGEIRVHVLIASNALYGRMFATAAAAVIGDREIRVASPEDLALLLSLADDEAAARERTALISLARFDRNAFNRRAALIGLAHLAVAE